MKITIWAFFLCLVIYPLHIRASDKQHFYLSGCIEKAQDDTISMILFHYDMLKDDGRRYSAVTDATGNFAFDIPLSSPDGNRLGQLSFRSAGHTYPIIDQVLLIENNDSLHFDVFQQKDLYNYHLSGNRTSKFNCEREISEILDQVNSRLKKVGSTDKDCIEKVKSIYSNCEGKLEDVLNKYKTKISPDVYDIIRADSYGSLYANNHLFALLQRMVNRNKISESKAFSFFNGIKVRRGIFADKNILLSHDFQTFLLTAIKYQLLFTGQKNITYRQVYDKAKKDRKGIVRDLLLIRTLKILDNQAVTESGKDSISLLWKEAAKSIGTPDLTAYALKKAEYKMKGSQICNFLLKDSLDRDVNLSKFKNKVMLIDVWFTGCISCVKYNKFMAENVFPVFANDSNVIFISICADLNKSTWVKSMKGGRYTRRENINLYTGGLGFDHPFLKYYEFDRGGVTLLIGKTGNIYSGDPPVWDAISLVSVIQLAENEDP